MNPSLELLENVLFSTVLNHNPLGSGKLLNRYFPSLLKSAKIKSDEQILQKIKSQASLDKNEDGW